MRVTRAWARSVLTSLDARRWPLRRQMRVLGLLLVTALALPLALTVESVRRSESARLTDAASQMTRAATQLAERYEYFQRTFAEQRAPTPLVAGDDAVLRALSEGVLQGAQGTEGGFYRAGGGALLGYAFPTYQGSGPKRDVPAAERPAIERVAARAVTGGAPSAEHVTAGSDVILFHARPVFDGEKTVGAVWLMRRLAGVRDPQAQAYFVSVVGAVMVLWGLAALGWVLTYRLDRGVARMESALRAMDAQPETPVPATGVSELDRVGGAVARFVQIIHEQQRERVALERRLARGDRMAALGRVVAGLAHEVRNPLASIKLKLHLARRDDDRRLAASFDVMESEIERLDRLVSRLLGLAKPAPPSAALVELSRLLASRLEFWDAQAKGAGITLALKVGRDPGFVPTDGERIAQIVDNLLANAIDALAPGGGRVTLELDARPDGPIVIAVTDDGPGVPREIAEHLFEPFVTTRASGTGLGLFVSAELARSLDGDVRWVPSVEVGARFEVHLPW